jgi:hypothetical protein
MTSVSPFWYISALSSALSILTVIACVFLFRSMRKQRLELAAGAAAKEELTAVLAKIQSELQDTKSGLRELKDARDAYLNRISETGGINLNQRGQILRLYRRGESPTAISSALRVPAGEVNLIVKVHEMTQDFLKLEKHEKAL